MHGDRDLNKDRLDLMGIIDYVWMMREVLYHFRVPDGEVDGRMEAMGLFEYWRTICDDEFPPGHPHAFPVGSTGPPREPGDTRSSKYRRLEDLTKRETLASSLRAIIQKKEGSVGGIVRYYLYKGEQEPDEYRSVPPIQYGRTFRAVFFYLTQRIGLCIFPPSSLHSPCSPVSNRDSNDRKHLGEQILADGRPAALEGAWWARGVSHLFEIPTASKAEEKEDAQGFTTSRSAGFGEKGATG
ncbi:hypothetical protein DFH06DRAFT_1137591 [Mycena polygramma]|nr:hypothetical protein DFH06DRAFT_1137591 [Mycena polygramma]